MGYALAYKKLQVWLQNISDSVFNLEFVYLGIICAIQYARYLHYIHTKYRVSQKRRPFLKIENIPNLLTDDKKGKIIENIK